jgi:hypothetical protein
MLLRSLSEYRLNTYSDRPASLAASLIGMRRCRSINGMSSGEMGCCVFVMPPTWTNKIVAGNRDKP